MSSELKPHTATLVSMFLRGFQDAASSVSSTALTATAACITAMSDEPEVMEFRHLIGPMITTIQNHVQATIHNQLDEQIVVDDLEVIQECVAMEQPLASDHIHVSIYASLSCSMSSFSPPTFSP